jgi:hypothetical protein
MRYLQPIRCASSYRPDDSNFDFVDLTKGFSLGGSQAIGAIWKMPPIGETFDARYG